jgi:hypothetical protein
MPAERRQHRRYIINRIAKLGSEIGVNFVGPDRG